MKPADLYKILRVPRTATVNEIKVAYRRLAIEFHPDTSKGSKEKAAELFKEIASAYATLGDAEQKVTYDREIGNWDWTEDPSKERDPFYERKHTPFGAATQRTPSPRAAKGPVKSEHFDENLWNHEHYGDVLIRLEKERLEKLMANPQHFVRMDRIQMDRVHASMDRSNDRVNKQQEIDKAVAENNRQG